MRPTQPRKVARQTRRTRLGSQTSLNCNWLLGWTWAWSLTSGAIRCQWTWGFPHRKAEGTQEDISVNCLDSAHNCLTYTGNNTWPWLYPIWVYNFFAFDIFLPEPAEGSRVLQSAAPCWFSGEFPIRHRGHRATGPWDFWGTHEIVLIFLKIRRKSTFNEYVTIYPVCIILIFTPAQSSNNNF